MKKLVKLVAFLAMILLISCEEDASVDRVGPITDVAVTVDDLSGSTLQQAQGKLGSKNVALYMAEYLTSGEGDEMGRTIIFMNVGNKQLGGDFLPGFSLDGSSSISYYVDANRPSADVSPGMSSNAIRRAMGTWDRLRCSELGMHELPYDGRPTGWVAAYLGFGGSFNYVADVVHNGWMGAPFFDELVEDGSTFILGVTFTIIFTDQNGNPVDTDNNGKYDVAWREIYYNDAFPWQVGNHIDIETVALHEAGHGLSQGHFGSAFFSEGNGKLHFSPRAVMNAAYSGIQTRITRSDKAGHCSNWAAWPEN